jgi:hypothetical protein
MCVRYWEKPLKISDGAEMVDVWGGEDMKRP